jgi:hypothetical protein
MASLLDNPGDKVVLYMSRLSKRWQLWELHRFDEAKRLRFESGSDFHHGPPQRRTGHLSPYLMMDHCGDSMHPKVTGLRIIDRQVPFSCCTNLKFAIPPAIWDGISICFTFTLMSRDLEDGRLIMRATYPGGWQASCWKRTSSSPWNHKRHADLRESGHGGFARAAHADVSHLRGHYHRDRALS